MMWKAATCVLLALLATTAAAAAELRPFVRGSWAEILAAHAGRPTVVVLWSVGCAPCVAELPQWKQLGAPGSGMDVVMVSVDPIAEPERPLRLLRRHGLEGLETWAFADRNVAALRHAIDPTWRGELPRTYVLAADGTVSGITGVVDEATLRRHLR